MGGPGQDPPTPCRRGAMQWEHRDPFDRLLVAQALTEGVPLLTIDPVVTHVPGLRTEDPRRSA